LERSDGMKGAAGSVRIVAPSIQKVPVDNVRVSRVEGGDRRTNFVNS
jgi:hypothetical protein